MQKCADYTVTQIIAQITICIIYQICFCRYAISHFIFLPKSMIMTSGSRLRSPLLLKIKSSLQLICSSKKLLRRVFSYMQNNYIIVISIIFYKRSQMIKYQIKVSKRCFALVLISSCNYIFFFLYCFIRNLTLMFF